MKLFVYVCEISNLAFCWIWAGICGLRSNTFADHRPIFGSDKINKTMQSRSKTVKYVTDTTLAVEIYIPILQSAGVVIESPSCLHSIDLLKLHGGSWS